MSPRTEVSDDRGTLPDARTREGREPDEAPRPLPLFFVAFVAAVGVWGAAYFWMETGSQPAAAGDRRSASALAAQAPAQDDGDGAADGAAIFTTRCVACHQASGMGLPGAFPPLGGSRWVTGDPSRAASILVRGLAGPIEVAGANFNGVMPSFADQLDDAEIAAVLSHVRTSFGNAAAPIDEETVRAARDGAKPGTIQGQAELEAL